MHSLVIDFLLSHLFTKIRYEGSKINNIANDRSGSTTAL